MEKLCVQLVPLFQQLTYDQQLQVEQLMHQTHIQKGEIALRPAAPHQLIILERGQLKAVHFTDDGRASQSKTNY